MTIQVFKDIQLNKLASIEIIEKMKFAYRNELLIKNKKDQNDLNKLNEYKTISTNTNQNTSLVHIQSLNKFYVFKQGSYIKYEVSLPDDFDEHYVELKNLVKKNQLKIISIYRLLAYIILAIGLILGIVLGDSIPVLSVDWFDTFNIVVALSVWVSSFFASMFWFWADDILKATREKNKNA